MKKWLILLVMLAPSCLWAANSAVQGTVHTLRDNANDLWGEDADHLLLNGVTEAGECGTSGGLVVIRIPGDADRAFSMALAAQMSGKEVVVGLDDTRTDSNQYCIMRWLNIAN